MRTYRAYTGKTHLLHAGEWPTTICGTQKGIDYSRIEYEEYHPLDLGGGRCRWLFDVQKRHLLDQAKTYELVGQLSMTGF